MPIYEYQCTGCHHNFDLMQKISDEPVKKCPQCLNDTAVRLVSAAGFQLKGSGWYVTDFKNKNEKKTGNQTSSSTTAKSSEAKPTSHASETSSTGGKD